MKTKLFSTILLLVLGIGLVSAQQPPVRGERWGERGRPMERFQGRQFMRQGRPGMQEKPGGFRQIINLSEEQKEALQKLHQQAVKDMKPLKDELLELEAHHQTLATAEKADMKKIDESIEKIGDVKTKIAKIQAKQQVGFRALLTDEQRMKLDMAKERPGNRNGNRMRNLRRG